MAKENIVRELRLDLLPEEIQFICKMCHIASNKRMVDKLACSNVAVEGRPCEHVERIRSILQAQGQELAIYRKYASAFIRDSFGERTVFQKNELVKLYNEKIVEGDRTPEEFIDLLCSLGIEVVGS